MALPGRMPFAVENLEARIVWMDLMQKHASAIAGWLNARRGGLAARRDGLQRAEYVAMLARNSVAYLAVCFGAMALGAATLNLNWRIPDEHTTRLVERLSPRLLVASEPYHEQANALRVAGVRVSLLEMVCVMEFGVLPFSRPAQDVTATLTAAIREVFDLRPAGIIRDLELKRPCFRKTAAYGHFGRPEFAWERTDRVEALQKKLG